MLSFRQFLKESDKKIDFCNYMFTKLASRYGHIYKSGVAGVLDTKGDHKFTVFGDNERSKFDVDAVIKLFKETAKNYPFTVKEVKVNDGFSIMVQHKEGKLEQIGFVSETKIILKDEMDGISTDELFGTN